MRFCVRYKKNGGKARPEKQLTGFRAMLDDCEVLDLRFSGVKIHLVQ